MKIYAFGFCIGLAFAQVFFAVYEHNLYLAAAWGSAFLGWTCAFIERLLHD